MFENTKIFPALQFNQLADPIEFVHSWSRYFPYDEPEFDRYLYLIGQESYTEKELLWLFEYLLGEKLVGEKLKMFNEDIGSRVRIWNVLKEENNIGDLYTDDLTSMNPRWFVLMHHLIYQLPFFDNNICRAYKFITGSEIDINSDEDFEVAHGQFVSLSDELVNLTPKYDEIAWRNALWAFGKFLGEFGFVMI